MAGRARGLAVLVAVVTVLGERHDVVAAAGGADAHVGVTDAALVAGSLEHAVSSCPVFGGVGAGGAAAPPASLALMVGAVGAAAYQGCAACCAKQSWRACHQVGPCGWGGAGRSLSLCGRRPVPARVCRCAARSFVLCAESDADDAGGVRPAESDAQHGAHTGLVADDLGGAVHLDAGGQPQHHEGGGAGQTPNVVGCAAGGGVQRNTQYRLFGGAGGVGTQKWPSTVGLVLVLHQGEHSVGVRHPASDGLPDDFRLGDGFGERIEVGDDAAADGGDPGQCFEPVGPVDNARAEERGVEPGAQITNQTVADHLQCRGVAVVDQFIGQNRQACKLFRDDSQFFDVAIGRGDFCTFGASRGVAVTGGGVRI